MLFVIDIMSNVVYAGFPLMLFLSVNIPFTIFDESSQFEIKLYRSEPSYAVLLIAIAEVELNAPVVLVNVNVTGDPEDPTFVNCPDILYVPVAHPPPAGNFVTVTPPFTPGPLTVIPTVIGQPLTIDDIFKSAVGPIYPITVTVVPAPLLYLT